MQIALYLRSIGVYNIAPIIIKIIWGTMPFKPDANYPGHAHTPENLREFNVERRDEILADMESAALLDWKKAATVTERAEATKAFAAATTARLEILPAVVGMRRRREEEAANRRRKASGYTP